MPKQKPPVEKNDDIQLVIDTLGTEGQGIGRLHGYAVFVPGALPGETVRAHIIKAGASFGVGKLICVEEPAKERVMPPCPLNGICGGCTLQHVGYTAQLVHKRRVVEDALKRIGGVIDANVLPTLGMEEPFYYRNKASFPFAEVDGKVEVGFFAPRSHRVVRVEDCLIQKTDVMLAALVVAAWASEHTISVYDEQSGKGVLRHVSVRSGSTGELMVTIVATREPKHTSALIERLRERLPALKSVYLNINSQAGNRIQGPVYRLLFGEPRILERIENLDFYAGPASFLQVNHLQAARLYTLACDALNLQSEDCVVDAYCGIGTISLLMAKRASAVVGIENVPQAVEDARENAVRNGISNARFLCAPAEEALPKLLLEGFQPNAVVLDPPRKGADAAFLEALIKSGVEKIVYVSCDPATLARDCKILIAGGYRLDYAQPVDMFPHTTHVETVVLLSRKAPNDVIHIDLELDEMDVTAAEAKATYQEIKDYVLDKYGFKVSQLYIAQVKRKHGIIERENYNKPKSEDAKVPQCPPEKETAIIEALK
ncbi:23S rRNA (uracil(1939)-C(5))-methyltransferase RlmD, partial [Christensenellaceae bacterium OttesenSCG-928-L17]|nr:23S rRNA (uracil(1939)-C(5))-methyltransferase RlmD [Christensenellaceae bacterium OttesenSCG-928-L17]